MAGGGGDGCGDHEHHPVGRIDDDMGWLLQLLLLLGAQGRCRRADLSTPGLPRANPRLPVWIGGSGEGRRRELGWGGLKGGSTWWGVAKISSSPYSSFHCTLVASSFFLLSLFYFVLTLLCLIACYLHWTSMNATMAAGSSSSRSALSQLQISLLLCTVISNESFGWPWWFQNLKCHI